jgi:hypothetical protein
MAVLNEDLLYKNNVSDEQQEQLHILYEELEYLLENAHTFTNKHEVPKLVRDIEFKLQSNWNFQQDETKHKYTFLIKGCICPKLDNLELFGQDSKYINTTCPYHGESHEDI